jgi:glycosyltransferase involved in cell wall biosynthesis
MNDAPLVSLCMATCLRSDLFPVSLRGLLAQTYAPLEIVVLVDGANEDSIALLKLCSDARVRWFSTPQPSGMIPAWNTVCKAARGKYLLFCADDDVLLPEAVQRHVELLEENPNVGFCHGDFLFIDDDDRELGRWISHEGTWVKSRQHEWPRYLVQTRCCMQTTLVRRQAWDEVGGWDEDAGNPGDNSLYLKLLHNWDVGHVEHITCKYRIRTKAPDSWAKRYRNVREYHLLAVRHLASPPPHVTLSTGRLSKRLHARLSAMSVPLLLSKDASPTDLSALREWLSAEVWANSNFGRLCAMLDALGLLSLLLVKQAAGARLRDTTKAFLRRGARLLNGRDAGI